MSIWVSRGFVVLHQFPIDEIGSREFFAKTDHHLMNTVPKIVRALSRDRVIDSWHSSRRTGDDGDNRSRARIYLQVKAGLQEKAKTVIAQNSDGAEVMEEFDPTDEREADFGARQIASEAAISLLPQVAKVDRNSESFLRIVDDMFVEGNIPGNWDGIHWLENNLGYQTCLLVKRFLQKGFVSRVGVPGR